MKNSTAITGTLIAILATGLPAQEKPNATPSGATNRPPNAEVATAVSAGPTVTDIDGNVYKTVTIGSQVWMAEDLKTTRYRNGDLIGTTSPATLDIGSEDSPKYQWAYAGDESKVATYGRLYTWFAVTDGRNIAPAGWHVPTDAEWMTLTEHLGGKKVAQGKLKEAGTTHWDSPNTEATNGSGFTAIPGGNRWPDGRFLGIGDFTHWWTATEHDAKFAWRRILVKGAPADNFRGYASKKIGWLVRCVRDLPAAPSAGSTAQERKQSAPADKALAVTYVANEGFLIEGAGKKVLVDAIFNNGYNTSLTPSPELLDQLTGARGPFADVDLLLVSHTHGDHFNPELVTAHMRNNARCQLVAHTQAVNQLRKKEGFAQIRDRIHEVKLEPGSRESIAVNGISVEVLGLPHSPTIQNGRNVHAQMRNLAFFVSLGGTRFLHLGDAEPESSAAQLEAFPFDETRIDLLFLPYFDQSLTAQRLIAEKIKPGRIVAMHVPPAELETELKNIRKVYPHAIVFKQSMERRSLPIGADFHQLSGDG
jgi:uncharacterized protein (TIGR02145 family)